MTEDHRTWCDWCDDLHFTDPRSPGGSIDRSIANHGSHATVGSGHWVEENLSQMTATDFERENVSVLCLKLNWRQMDGRGRVGTIVVSLQKPRRMDEIFTARDFPFRYLFVFHNDFAAVLFFVPFCPQTDPRRRIYIQTTIWMTKICCWKPCVWTEIG